MLHKFVAVLAISGFIALSCAGGSSPALPSLDSNPTDGTGNTQDLNSFTGRDSCGALPRQLWGYYSISIDPESMEAEIAPLRGAEFTANVTRFMQPPISPTNMVSISLLSGSDPSTGYFDVEVTLRHPFPGIPLYRGFDVRGILVSDGSATSEHDSSATYAVDGDTVLLNADGLTRWWNPTEFTSYGSIFGYTPGKLAPQVYPDATLNSFKYFADDLDSEDPVYGTDTDMRGTFPTSPGVYSRRYEIQFAMDGPDVDFTFNYAVDASWAEPDSAGAPNYDVEDYALSANSVEPYCISVVDNGSTAFYEDADNFGGELNLAVRIYDWQAVENPDGVPGELNALWLESPVMQSPVDVLGSATILPDGPTSSVFEVSLGNLDLNGSGDFPMLVFAEVTEDLGYEPQIDGGDMFDYPDNPLGAYFMATVHIAGEGITDAPVVLSIDPDNGMYDEILTDVLVGGLNFQSGAQVELRRDDWPTIEASNESTSPDGTEITCDLDLADAAEGYWDVVVINPDTMEGILEDGFLVTCNDGVHADESRHYLTGGLEWKYCQRCAITILETGPYAGEAILRRSWEPDTTFTSPYVRFDPDNAANTTPVDFFSLPARDASDGSGNYLTGTNDIDQNPVNGHIAVINGRMFEVIQIVDENGTPMPSENIIVTDPQTLPDYRLTIPAIDFDENGDLWLVANVTGNPEGYTVQPTWQMRHYELQETSPYYVEDESDRIDITDDLVNPDTNPTHMYYIADIAISFEENTMVIASATYIGGSFYNSKALFSKYDLNTTPPTLLATEDLVGPIQLIRGLSKCSKLDIEYDHSDPGQETCRLVCLYQVNSGGVFEDHIMKLDSDLNILADETVLVGGDMWDAPQSIAINIDSDLRNLVSMDMQLGGALNDFYYFPMPSSGW